MTLSTNQGATATVSVSWSVAGTPTDVTNQTISVSAVGGASVIAPTGAGIYHASTGLYEFSWAVPATQAVGDYLATWNATLGSSAVTNQQVVTVQDANYGVTFPFLTWCDITLNLDLLANKGSVFAVDPVTWVKNVTGSTLTVAQIQSAQQILNMYSNYTPEASGFNMQPFDLRWLRYGLAYQAVWMVGNPGLLYRAEVDTISQDGLSTHWQDPRNVMLAPLALRSLKQLSWQKSRSLRVRTPFIDDQTPMSSDPDAEANDLYERWVDMYNFGYRGSSVP